MEVVPELEVAAGRRQKKTTTTTTLCIALHSKNGIYLIITGGNPTVESIDDLFHVTAVQRCVRTSQVCNQLIIRLHTLFRIIGLNIRQKVIQGICSYASHRCDVDYHSPKTASISTQILNKPVHNNGTKYYDSSGQIIRLNIRSQNKIVTSCIQSLIIDSTFTTRYASTIRQRCLFLSTRIYLRPLHFKFMTSQLLGLPANVNTKEVNTFSLILINK